MDLVRSVFAAECARVPVRPPPGGTVASRAVHGLHAVPPAAARLHAPWPGRARPAGPRAARPYACATVIVRVRYVMPDGPARAYPLPSWTYVLMAGCAQSIAEQTLRQSCGMIALAPPAMSS
jgi:hypothetical protein